MSKELKYKVIKPEDSLADFVESFWFLQNQTDSNKEIILLPDGRVDLIFTSYPSQPIQTTLLGMATKPDHTILSANTTLFAISFKLPSVEYVIKKPVPELLDSAEHLSENFWEFTATNFNNFQHFIQKASHRIQSVLPQHIDNRKEKLFELIYTSKGEMTVKELAENAGWSSRQINRYFNQHFGLSLKTYCNILRFRASFKHLKEGKLYPQQDFTDQSHFIKEVKKLSGVSPKELKQNHNDRFIQFSTLVSK